MTYAEAKAAYLANAGYSSVSEARAFLVACRQLLILVPSRSQKGTQGDGEQIEFDVTVIERQLDRAENYVATREDGGGVTVADLSCLRG